jgi:hypothetical protein
LRFSAFELAGHAKDSTCQVTFTLLRANVMKVDCGSKPDIFFIPPTSADRVVKFLGILKRFQFVSEFSRLSEDTFEVTLSQSADSIAA